MCAIAGVINYFKYDLESIKNSLIHRGVDEQSIVKYNNLALIHTRLSIQDISNGHQPFEYGNYAIIFNGEIYNHLELRDRYLKEFKFKTASDTETLLYMYIKFKNDMFKYLDAMFAFAIFNKKENTLVLSRDRMGKKPLYFYNNGSDFFFASELNAIKQNIDLKIDELSIEAYLRNGFFYNTTTPYKDVYEVLAGYVYNIDLNSLTIKKEQYFNLLELYKSEKIVDYEYAKSNLDKILHKSIESRLISSDVEVGAFLSGGIDSSLIVAIASKYKQNLKTFTVKFDDAFNEAHLAKLTANRYNTSHYELEISMNLEDDIEKILLNYGEPFMDSSAIPSYYVSLEAKKYVKVVLNGDGADEIFGGYRRYIPTANNILKVASNFSVLLKVLPKPHNKKSLYNYFYRLLAMANKDGIDFYNSAVNDIFEDIYFFKENSINKDMDSFIKKIYKENISELSKFLYLDSMLLLKNDLLKKMDIASMQFSLEARSPFLSKYMLEFAPKLDDKFKIDKTTTKYILRDLAKKYIDKTLITQPKRGFEVPLKKWVENDLKDRIFTKLDKKDIYSHRFVKKEFLDKLLAKKIDISDEKRAKMLWSLYALEVWRDSI